MCPPYRMYGVEEERRGKGEEGKALPKKEREVPGRVSRDKAAEAKQVDRTCVGRYWRGWHWR